MKTIAFLFPCALLFSTFIYSCEIDRVSPSGNIVTLDYNLTDYDVLRVSDDFNVFVNYSDTEESIQVKVDENLENKVIVEKDGNTLVIRLDGIVNLTGNITLEAYVSVSTLKEIIGRGDATIEFENTLEHETVKIDLAGDSKLVGPIVTNRLDVDLSGDSKFELTNTFDGNSVSLDVKSDSEFTGAFNVTDFRADLGGDAEIRIEGSAETASIDASGDSDIRDFGFTVKDLIINLRSDSEARLTVTGTIDVRASGDSKLEYKGDANITDQHLTGDSKVRKIG